MSFNNFTTHTQKILFNNVILGSVIAAAIFEVYSRMFEDLLSTSKVEKTKQVFNSFIKLFILMIIYYFIKKKLK